MKFFKHFTDAHRGSSLQILKQKHGMAAVGRYWTLVEICAEKMSKEKDEAYTEHHCTFAFAKPYLASSLAYANLKQASCYLDALSELGLCSVQDMGDVWACSMPKLLECIDRDNKRARTERASTAPKNKIKIKNKEEDKETDKDKECFAEIEKIYADLYPLKKGKSEGIKKAAKEIKTADDLLKFEAAVIRYANDCKVRGTDPQYIKHFSSFVSTWRDWLDPEVGKSTVTPIMQGNRAQATIDRLKSQAERIAAGEL